jgi:hypothetical protein
MKKTNKYLPIIRKANKKTEKINLKRQNFKRKFLNLKNTENKQNSIKKGRKAKAKNIKNIKNINLNRNRN